MTDRCSDLALFRRLLRQGRPYRFHILGLFLLSLSSAPLALLTPLPLKIAVDCVIRDDPLPGFLKATLPAAATGSDSALLAVTCALLVMIAVLTQLQSLVSSILQTYTAERLVQSFRGRLFRQVQRLSLLSHDCRGMSDFAYHIQYDAQAIQYVVIDGLIPFTTACLTVTSMLYVSFRLDWQLSLVALTISPVLFLLVRLNRLQLRDRSREVKKLESTAFSVVHEVLSAIRVVKAFGQEDREHQRFLCHSNRGITARIHLALIEGGMSLLIGLTTAGGTATILFIGARHVLSGSLTLGELLLIMSYVAQLYGPLKTVSRKTARLQSHLASAERAYSLLDQGPDVPERRGARSVTRAAGAFALRNVCFAYEADHPVLSDVCCEVPAGTSVGIVGRTGVGKTTLANLLTRFYDPGSGQILLDGVDLRDYKLAELRNQFAIVLQEPILFSTSIAENIAYARPEATRQEIQQAAEAANAHSFIVDLPDGYETRVGQRGMRLSGGERQRIALARAFLKDAPILILDEPTSSVDVATETGIMEAMRRLMHGRTAFMIAHRPSTLNDCGLLLTINDGGCVTVTPVRPVTVDSETFGRQHAAIREASVND